MKDSESSDAFLFCWLLYVYILPFMNYLPDQFAMDRGDFTDESEESAMCRERPHPLEELLVDQDSIH